MLLKCNIFHHSSHIGVIAKLITAAIAALDPFNVYHGYVLPLSCWNNALIIPRVLYDEDLCIMLTHLLFWCMAFVSKWSNRLTVWPWVHLKSVIFFRTTDPSLWWAPKVLFDSCGIRKSRGALIAQFIMWHYFLGKLKQVKFKRVKHVLLETLLPALWLGELKSKCLSLLFQLLPTVLCVVQLRSFSLRSFPNVLLHILAEDLMCCLFSDWENITACFLRDSCPESVKAGFFSGNFSLLYEACFSDSSTPPAGKDVFSIPGCPSELAQVFFLTDRLECSTKAMYGMYLWSRTASLLSLISLKKGNFLATGIHYVE